MRILRPILSFWAFFCCVSLGWADSPLFSTDFSAHYQDAPAVLHAQKFGPDASTQAAVFNPKLTSDVRAALIQVLMSQPQSEALPSLLLKALSLLKDKPAESLQLSDIENHELFAYAYALLLHSKNLKAEGDGQNLATTSAMPLLEKVVASEPQNFTYALIFALAKGNIAMESDFCQVWREMETVLNKGLKVNLRKAALDSVLAYVSLYKQDCVEKETRAASKKVEPLRTITSPGTVRISFDGTDRFVSTSSRDKALRIFSARDGSLLQKLELGFFSDRPEWSKNGKHLAFGDWQPALRLYNAQTWAETLKIPLPARATAVAFLDTEPMQLLAGLFDGQLVQWDASGKQVRSIQAHEKYISSILVRPDHSILTASYDASVALWSPEGNLLRRTSCVGGCFLREATDGKVVVYDFGDRWTVLDPATGRHDFEPVQLSTTLHDLAVLPERSLVAVALSSGVVEFFELSTGKRLTQIRAHEDQALSVAFSEDGELMVTGSVDGTLRLWKVSDLF